MGDLAISDEQQMWTSVILLLCGKNSARSGTQSHDTDRPVNEESGSLVNCSSLLFGSAVCKAPCDPRLLWSITYVKRLLITAGVQFQFSGCVSLTRWNRTEQTERGRVAFLCPAAVLKRLRVESFTARCSLSGPLCWHWSHTWSTRTLINTLISELLPVIVSVSETWIHTKT